MTAEELNAIYMAELEKGKSSEQVVRRLFDTFRADCVEIMRHECGLLPNLGASPPARETAGAVFAVIFGSLKKEKQIRAETKR